MSSGKTQSHYINGKTDNTKTSTRYFFFFFIKILCDCLVEHRVILFSPLLFLVPLLIFLFVIYYFIKSSFHSLLSTHSTFGSLALEGAEAAYMRSSTEVLEMAGGRGGDNIGIRCGEGLKQ